MFSYRCIQAILVGCNEKIFSLNFHALRLALALVWIWEKEEIGKQAAVVLTFVKFNRHKVVWLFHFFFFGIHFIKQSQMIYILRIIRNETNIFLSTYISGTTVESLVWYFYLPQIIEVGINMNILKMRKVSLMDD